MRHTAVPFLLAAALLAAAAPPPTLAADQAAPPPPTGLARFTSHPRFAAVKISPRGTYLAAEAYQGGVRTLVFLKTATREVTFTFNPTGTTSVGRFFWASDERVVIELLDHGGTTPGPSSHGEIYAVNADGTGGKMIFGYRAGGGGTGTNMKVAEPERAWGQVLDTLRNDDRYVLVGARSMDDQGDRLVRLWKVDVQTGLKRQVGAAPLPDAHLFTDEAGQARLAVGYDLESTRRWFIWEDEKGWRDLKGLAGFDPAGEPVAYLAKERAVEVVEPYQGGFGLFAVSVDGGERRLLARTAVAPPDAFVRDQATRRTVVLESEPDLPAYEFLDPGHPIAKVLDGLLAAYEGQHVRIVSRTEDDRLAVAFVYSDRNPGEYLLVDVARLHAETLAGVRPWIPPAEMGETQAFHIAASDGLRIHGYLTLPPGPAAAVKPPLVILTHGGPHGVRDAWGFDPQVQLLATQGFAVLQVNYRGSGGYGDAYEEAGFRRWGDRVIQDVVDAARWAVKKGKVDGARVCAMGASFGAYASMQAAILAPDLVRCAVGLSGIYDLTLMDWRGDIAWRPRGRAYVKKAVGDDPATLRAFSPVANAARLEAAVLLAHGGQDARAPLVHAERLRDALAALGRPPEWLEEGAEGHGFFDEAARERLAVKVVAFLKRHTEPTPAAAPAAAAPTPVP